MPKTALNERFAPGEQDLVLQTLKQQIPSHGEFLRAQQAFLRYYTRRASFADNHSSWDSAEDPELFWQLHYGDNGALSELADRLLRTLANSVLCERNFSSMNRREVPCARLIRQECRAFRSETCPVAT